jgi:NADPH:quinone reductase-like Zn-dependent oxidoreductase
MPDTARMDAVPETMRVLKVTGIGKLAIRNVPLPTLRRDYVLIKVHTAALNPTDW